MSPGGKRKLDVRLFLWGLFLLQISLICLFLLFGSLLVSTAVDDTDGQTAEQLVGTDVHGQKSSYVQRRPGQALSDWSPFRVRFIPNRTTAAAVVIASSEKRAATIGLSNSLLQQHESQAAWASQGIEQDDGQLLKRKQLHPRHPKYRPWIQRVMPRPERAEKYFRTISYVDWHGTRKRRLCFIEGTRGSALVTSMDQQNSKGNNNETEPIDTGIEGVVGNGKELRNAKGKPNSADTSVEDSDGSVVTVGEDAIGRCRCNPQWHGTDCGQPEVIWRAFITSKIPPRDQMAGPRAVGRNVFYIVQSTFISVEVLEVQLMELADQVSLFVLCDQTRNSSAPLSKDVSIADHVEGTDFLRTIRDRLLIVSDATCSGRNVFRKLQKYTTKGSIRADDIVLLSGTDEILNRKAVAYLRWYDNWPQPVRFRLKHNVYGFFWQHAGNRTFIGSAAVQVGTLREVYGSDPDRLLAIDKPVMLIGDLNHFGGWYCRRCYQPGSIVQYFEHRAGLLTTVPRAQDSKVDKTHDPPLFLPDPKRTKVLNEEYVQQAIAAGKDLEDDERVLERLSRRTDKYYQPEYVRENGWKFDNIVLNLFARWEDNLAEDDYFS
uniref:Beta-1,4-mannosyl-glycoprotein beta-1,4-N-acetylglucosaminyltransferase n=1 Tax=Anopheles atroparvus TaxID=41427 RepID=A0AAG5DBQ1_ANOAO